MCRFGLLFKKILSASFHNCLNSLLVSFLISLKRWNKCDATGALRTHTCKFPLHNSNSYCNTSYLCYSCISDTCTCAQCSTTKLSNYSSNYTTTRVILGSARKSNKVSELLVDLDHTLCVTLCDSHSLWVRSTWLPGHRNRSFPHPN